MKKCLLLAAAGLTAGCATTSPAATHSPPTGASTTLTAPARSGNGEACASFWVWLDNQQTVSFAMVQAASPTTLQLAHDMSQLVYDHQTGAQSVSLTNDSAKVQGECNELGYANPQG